MKLTITIDPDRVERFGDPAETLQDFARRVAGEARTGGHVVWTQNAANVGTVDHVEFGQGRIDHAPATINGRALRSPAESMRAIRAAHERS